MHSYSNAYNNRLGLAGLLFHYPMTSCSVLACLAAAQEVLNALNLLGLDVSEAYLDGMMQNFDSENGTVDYNEFLRLHEFFQVSSR